jgi:D-alanyl-D-alanine carboxypeptidase
MRAWPATLIGALCVVVAAGCASTQAVAPPAPDVELLSGTPGVASSTTTVTSTTTEVARVAPTTTQAPPATGWTAYEQVLRRSIAEGGSPGASAAIVVDGDVVRASAFGVRVPGTLERTEPEDRFRIASISKVITAIVTMQLVEAGLVGLDEPIGERLAAHVGVFPSDGDVSLLTVRHLMSHTSGVPEYDSAFFGYEGGGTCTDVAARVVGGGIGTPGGGFRYSNANVCVLGIVIEMLTGQPYPIAVYERLLTPLGISGMRIAGTYDVGPDEALHPSVPGRSYMEALGAAGAWVATASDVARIVDSLRPDGTGWRPLSAESVELMTTPALGPPTSAAGYGLGLIRYPDGSFGHTGTLENTHAMVLARPDGITWAILVNGEYPNESERLRTLFDRALRTGFPDG